MLETLKTVAAVVASLTAIIGAWIAVGGPVPATSQDIKRLDKTQADTAVDLYSKDVRDAIILRGTVQDETTRRLIDENLREAQDKLKSAQQRKIELSK